MLPADSVARRVNRETVVLLGWGRAILMQLAHPLVAAGVGDYSHFHHGPGSYVRRAKETVGAMLAVTFGTSDEAQRAADQINSIHNRVNGRLGERVGVFDAGTPYSARDPRLLLWVHVTLVESLVLSYETFVEPLTPADRDRYAQEARWLTEQLGVEPSQVPATYADVQKFLADRYASGEITVGPTARRLAVDLLTPSLGPLAAPLFRPTRLMTIGLLPPHLREPYGFAWDDRRERAFRRWVRVIGGARRGLPRMLREWPAARRVANSRLRT